MASAFFWKICFRYSDRSNPAKKLDFWNFYESNLTEARFDSLPFYYNDDGTALQRFECSNAIKYAME